MHARAKHTNADPFKCNRCGKTFAYVSNYMRHVKVAHKTGPANPTFQTISKETVEFMQSSSSSEQSFRTGRQTQLLTDPEEACVKNVPSDEPKNVTEKVKKCKLYQCPDCSKTFPNPSSLSLHHNKHSALHDYQCTLCSRVYIYRTGLYQHMKTKHPGHTYFPTRLSRAQSKEMRQMEFTCDVCQKCFDKLKYLRRHQKHVHTTEGRVVCEECGLNFFGKTSLNMHVRAKHTKADPFKCTRCGKTFLYVSSYMRHVKVAHESDQTEKTA
ncbi:zinc finger, C2H2 type, partial [Opisthorchis viverrini]